MLNMRTCQHSRAVKNEKQLHNPHIDILLQGFGVAAKSTQECRHADPTSIIAFHQADIGQYIRSEDILV